MNKIITATDLSSLAATTALPGLMTPSSGYKPFRYPWAHEYWKS